MKRWLLAAAATTSLVAAAAWLVTSGPDETAGAVAIAQRTDFRVQVEATGKLEAEKAFEIGPPSVRDVWNYNLKWMIPEGRQVKEGDVVARFDTTELDERLRDYGAQIETLAQEREKEQRNLEISLRQLRLDLVKAEGELRTAEVELAVPPGLVSKIRLGQLKLDHELAAQRVAFLREKIEFEGQLVEAKLELLDIKKRRAEQLSELVQSAKDRFSVRAPSDGLVMYIPKRDGDRWEVGERVWMLAKLLKVADVSTLRAEAQVLEVDAARIEVGQRAQVSVDALPGSRIDTRIASIGRLVRERSVQDRSKVLDAYLPVEEFDPELIRPGMGVRVTIDIAVLPDRITLPITAIRVGERGPFVEVLRPNGAAEVRPVELGPRDGDRVVVEAGVAEGERVRLPVGRRA